MPDEVSVTVETPTPEATPPSEPAVIVVATPPQNDQTTLVELAQQVTRLETSLSTYQSEISAVRAEVSAVRSEIPAAVASEIQRMADETTEDEVIEVIPEPVPAVKEPTRERHPIAVLFLGKLP